MQAAHRLEHAVDAVAQPQEGRFRLEMDIRGAVLDRVREQGIDQPHHRVGVLAPELQAAPVHLASLDFAEDAIDREIEAIEIVELFEYLGFRSQYRTDFVAAFQVRAYLILGDQVENIRNRYGEDERVVIHRQGQDEVSPGEVFGQEGDGLRIGNRL